MQVPNENKPVKRTLGLQQYRVLNQDVSEKYLLKVKKSIGKLRSNKIKVRKSEVPKEQKNDLTVDIQFSTFHDNPSGINSPKARTPSEFLCTYGEKNNLSRKKYQKSNEGLSGSASTSKLNSKLRATASRIMNSDLRITTMSSHSNLSQTIKVKKPKSELEKEEHLNTQNTSTNSTPKNITDQGVTRMLDNYEEQVPKGNRKQCVHIRSISNLAEESIDQPGNIYMGNNIYTHKKGGGISIAAYEYGAKLADSSITPHTTTNNKASRLIHSAFKTLPLTKQNSIEGGPQDTIGDSKISLRELSNTKFSSKGKTSIMIKNKRLTEHYKGSIEQTIPIKLHQSHSSLSSKITHLPRDNNSLRSEFLQKYDIIAKYFNNMSNNITLSELKIILNNVKDGYIELLGMAKKSGEDESVSRKQKKQILELKNEVDELQSKKSKLEKSKIDLELQKLSFCEDIKDKMYNIITLESTIYNLKEEKAQAIKESEKYETNIIKLTKENKEIKNKYFDIKTKEDQRESDLRYKVMKNQLYDLKEELEYSQQRENKLMYLLYIIQEKGYPVKDIYEAEVRDLDTNRFVDGNCIEGNNVSDRQVSNSFDSEGSYDLIPQAINCPAQTRPKLIPNLQIIKTKELPESSSGDESYESSIRNTEILKKKIVTYFSSKKPNVQPKGGNKNRVLRGNLNPQNIIKNNYVPQSK